MRRRSGRSRFSDIIGFNWKQEKAYIIDPTIRYEINDTVQGSNIIKEKSSIHKKCISFYKGKYGTSI